MDAVVPVAILSVILGGVIAFLAFGNYFRKRKSEVESISKADAVQPNQKSSPKPSQQSHHTSKKSHAKSHSHAAADKVNQSMHINDGRFGLNLSSDYFNFNFFGGFLNIK